MSDQYDIVPPSTGYRVRDKSGQVLVDAVSEPIARFVVDALAGQRPTLDTAGMPWTWHGSEGGHKGIPEVRDKSGAIVARVLGGDRHAIASRITASSRWALTNPAEAETLNAGLSGPFFSVQEVRDESGSSYAVLDHQARTIFGGWSDPVAYRVVATILNANHNNEAPVFTPGDLEALADHGPALPWTQHPNNPLSIRDAGDTTTVGWFSAAGPEHGVEDAPPRWRAEEYAKRIAEAAEALAKEVSQHLNAGIEGPYSALVTGDTDLGYLVLDADRKIALAVNPEHGVPLLRVVVALLNEATPDPKDLERLQHQDTFMPWRPDPKKPGQIISAYTGNSLHWIAWSVTDADGELVSERVRSLVSCRDGAFASRQDGLLDRLAQLSDDHIRGRSLAR